MSEIAVQPLNFSETLLLPGDTRQQEATTMVNAEIDQRANPSLLHKLGNLATNAAAAVQESINGLAIRAQMKAWDAAEAVSNTIISTKEYLKQKGGKAAVRIGLAALALTGTGLGALKESSTAYAATNQANYQIVDGPWYLHAPNGPPQIASTTIGLAQTGDTLTIACHETGDTVSGDAEWDLVTDQNNGLTGLVADYGTNTPVGAAAGTAQGQESQQLTALGIPECGDNSTQPVNPEYNREAAVEWALANAQDPQTNGEECTKFVSEALWAGGMPQDSQWNNNGSYLSGEPFPTLFDGTKTANSAPMLISYLEQNYSTQWIPLGEMNAGNNNVPEAEPGDIIVYSWQGANPDGSPVSIDHLAFVVGDASNNPQYPMVAEWGQFENYGPSDYVNNPTSPYVERGWTYSEINHMYLQQEKDHQNMTAYLLHINGGTFTPSY
ncbi:MAG TPA: amidase domain-containing protein [Candidatus Saccharimonadales bacterium]|nr:amidase domain-containing protein [Candidatus Saccharimonadales bacterium]